jgi:hypothetical protein
MYVTVNDKKYKKSGNCHQNFVCMVTLSHFDLPEGGGHLTRQHLKAPMLKYFNIKFGKWSERNPRYSSALTFRHGTEHLLEMDPGNQKVLDTEHQFCMVTPSHFDLPEEGGYRWDRG